MRIAILISMSDREIIPNFAIMNLPRTVIDPRNIKIRTEKPILMRNIY